jgi:hypothetical protein
VETDTGSCAVELQQLVDGSRHMLAAARRTIATYKVVSLRARIDPRCVYSQPASRAMRMASSRLRPPVLVMA